jgi:hypothetical protein
VFGRLDRQFVEVADPYLDHVGNRSWLGFAIRRQDMPPSRPAAGRGAFAIVESLRAKRSACARIRDR